MGDPSGSEEEQWHYPRRSTRAAVFQKKPQDEKKEGPQAKKQRTSEEPTPASSDPEDQAEDQEAPQAIPEDPREQIRQSWKFVHVIQFFKIFKNRLDLKVAADVLESELLTNSPQLPLIPDMALILLKIHNRPTTKPIWERVARGLVNRVRPTVFPENEMSFFNLPLLSRIEVLYRLCDVVFDLHPEEFREEPDDPEAYKIAPFGEDAEGRRYWHFNDTRLYRETLSPRGKREDPLSWEVICDSKERWEEMAEEFRDSKNKGEKELHEALGELLPRIVGRLTQKERDERRQAFFESIPRKNSTRLIDKKENEERAKREAEERRALREIEIQQQKEERLKEQEERRRIDLQRKQEEAELRRQQEEIRKLEAEREQAELEQMEVGEERFQREMALWRKERGEPPKLDRVTREKYPVEWHTIFQCITTSNRVEPMDHRFVEMLAPINMACKGLVSLLQEDENAWPFKEPVDPTALGLEDYFDVIKHPMDLSTVSKKLAGNRYPVVEDFRKDLALMFHNCFQYNLPDSDIVDTCRHLETKFLKYFKKIDFSFLLTKEQKERYEVARAKFREANPGASFDPVASTAETSTPKRKDRVVHVSPQRAKQQLDVDKSIPESSPASEKKKKEHRTTHKQHRTSDSLSSKPLGMVPPGSHSDSSAFRSTRPSAGSALPIAVPGFSPSGATPLFHPPRPSLIPQFAQQWPLPPFQQPPPPLGNWGHFPSQPVPGYYHGHQNQNQTPLPPAGFQGQRQLVLPPLGVGAPPGGVHPIGASPILGNAQFNPSLSPRMGVGMVVHPSGVAPSPLAHGYQPFMQFAPSPQTVPAGNLAPTFAPSGGQLPSGQQLAPQWAQQPSRPDPAIHNMIHDDAPPQRQQIPEVSAHHHNTPGQPSTAPENP